MKTQDCFRPGMLRALVSVCLAVATGPVARAQGESYELLTSVPGQE